MMSIKEIENLDREFLTPTEVGQFFGVTGHQIAVQARTAPQSLGFPIVQIGKRYKFPKAGFLRFVRGESNEAQKKNGRYNNCTCCVSYF